MTTLGQEVSLNNAQPGDITLWDAMLPDGLQPHCVWDVQGVKDAQERETADFGQMDQWTSVCYGYIHFPSAHARSSIIAWC